ncbi:uncharacterized protein LOC123523411 [Mercenaria mercenaria]|uniref:uncharacterized protein LOC123523411 n=1 Tax=Mercenaria mercenaria TaxID=6596 RepID=UPI00234E561D|nr:uncharacterized protein LOC123523411 [Mercenaria mercenaria]
MAHLYQVSNLVQLCADYLATIITSENACAILTLAWRYDVTILRDACCYFIDNNADEILQSDDFLELSNECLTYILKGDTFYADEEDICIKTEEWSMRKLDEDNLENHGPNMRQALDESFYYLRLPTMTYNTLMMCTRKKGYFSVEEYEDIVDFVNGIPDASVKSNSCVARLPTVETLLINDEDGEAIVSDNHTTIFIISVSRDVKLKNICLSEIHKYLKHDNKLYSDRNCKSISINDDTVAMLYFNYKNKVIKLTNLGRNGKGLSKLREVTGQDLPVDLNLVVSGSLQVTHPPEVPRIRCWMDKTIKEKYEEEDLDEIGNGLYDAEVLDDDVDYDDHDDEGERMIYEQEIQLQMTDRQQVIHLKEPVTFTKAGSYIVSINLKYSCKSVVKMKTCTSSRETVTSQYGHVKVVDLSGRFAGIKSLGFEHFSNRESVKESKMIEEEF